MAKSVSTTLIATIAAACVVVLLGVGAAYYFLSGDSPAEARVKLEQLGVPFEQTAFVNAVRKGDPVVVDLFLKAEMSPGAVNGSDLSAMTVAAAAGQVKIMKRLAEAGASVNGEPGRTGITPLMAAVQTRRPEAVAWLLSHDADVDRRLERGLSALDLAVLKNDRNVVDALVKAGADVSKPATYPADLLIAAQNGRLRLTDALPDLLRLTKAPSSANGAAEMTPLGIAITVKAPEATEALLANDADPNVEISLPDGRKIPLLALLLEQPDSRTVMMLHHLLKAGLDLPFDKSEFGDVVAGLVQTGKTSLASVMIEAADPSTASKAAFVPILSAALQRGNAKLADTILDKAGSLNVQSNQARELVEAAIDRFSGKERADIVGKLFAAGLGKKLAGERVPLLGKAIERGDTATVVLVLNQSDKLDPAALTELLDEAALAGKMEFVEPLVKAGADVNARNADGRTPLFEAASSGNVKIISKLLDAGAKVDGADLPSSSELLSAAITGSSNDNRQALIETLLDAGAKVEVDPDKPQVSPIATALVAKDPNLAGVLLARMSSVSKTQATALLGWGLQQKFPDLASALLDRGADPNGHLQDGEGFLARAIEIRTAEAHPGTVADALIKAGADVNTPDGKGILPIVPAVDAAMSGDGDLLDALLKGGAKVPLTDTKADNLVLSRALANGNEKVALLLLDHVDKEKKAGLLPALQLAIKGGERQAVEALMARGVEDDWPSDKPPLALWTYSAGQGKDVLDVLAKHGVDLAARDGDDETVFWLAWSHGDRKTMDGLRAMGVKDVRTPKRATADARLAVEQDDISALRYLASIDAYPDEGFTKNAVRPIALAAEKGNQEAIGVLMDMKVPVGMDAVKAAAHAKHGALANLLLDFIIKGGVPVIAPRIAPGDIIKVEARLTAPQLAPDDRKPIPTGALNAPKISPARPLTGDVKGDATISPAVSEPTPRRESDPSLAPMRQDGNNAAPPALERSTPASAEHASADSPAEPVKSTDARQSGNNVPEIQPLASHETAANASSPAIGAPAPARSQKNSCRTWDDPVTLEGTLFHRAFPGPPNFESIAKGDKRIVGLFLTLSQPICLLQGDIQMDNQQALDHVTVIQLEWETSGKPPIGSKVELHGRFFAQMTGYHQTPALLAVEKWHMLAGKGQDARKAQLDDRPAQQSAPRKAEASLPSGVDLEHPSLIMGQLRFVKSRANVRAAPSTGARVLATYDAGQSVLVIGTKGQSWLVVDYRDSGASENRAYISANLVTPDAGLEVLKGRTITAQQAKQIMGPIDIPELKSGFSYINLAPYDLNGDGAPEVLLSAVTTNPGGGTVTTASRLLILDGKAFRQTPRSYRLLYDGTDNEMFFLAVQNRPNPQGWRDIMLLNEGRQVLSYSDGAYRASGSLTDAKPVNEEGSEKREISVEPNPGNAHDALVEFHKLFDKQGIGGALAYLPRCYNSAEGNGIDAAEYCAAFDMITYNLSLTGQRTYSIPLPRQYANFAGFEHRMQAAMKDGGMSDPDAIEARLQELAAELNDQMGKW